MSQPEVPPGPPITDQMREQARATPNSWLYIVDPAYQDSGDDIPPHGIMGAYHIDDNGEIDEQFHRNDSYEPSDLVFELPEPTNSLEQLLNQIALGTSADTELPAAIIAAEVLLYTSGEDAAGEDEAALFAAEMSDGSQLVPACSSMSRVPEDWPGYRRVPGHRLPELLGGLDLGLNLDDGVRAVVPHSLLVQAAAGGQVSGGPDLSPSVTSEE